MMVLGLRSKAWKSKGKAVHVEFEICLVEIKPWQRFQSSKPVILLWHRGDKHSGVTKIVMPQVEADSDGGKIAFNESFRLPTILYPELSKKGSKLGRNGMFQEKLVVFSLHEAGNSRGQPLGTASLDLAAYATIQEQKRITIPLTTSKRVSPKQGFSNLLLVVGQYRENKVSRPVGAEEIQRSKSSVDSLSSALSQSSRTSDGYSSAAIDEQSRESLVTALLSEEDEEIAEFTDDEDSLGSASPTQARSVQSAAGAVTSDNSLRPEVLVAHESSSNSAAHQENVKSKTVVSSSPQSSPVKAAAAAAAAAYAPKRSFLSQRGGSSWASSNGFSSESASPETEGFCTPCSYGARSPNVVCKSPPVASLALSHTSTTAASDAHMKKIGQLDDDDTPEKEINSGNVQSLVEVKAESLESLEAAQVEKARHENAVNISIDISSGKPIQDDKRHSKEQAEMSSLKSTADILRGSSKNAPKELSMPVQSVVKLATGDTSGQVEGKQAQKPNSTKVLNPTKLITEKQSNMEADRGNGTELNVSKSQKTGLDGSQLKHSTLREWGTAVEAKEMNVLEEARVKFSKGSDMRNEKIEKKVLEEAKMKVVKAEAKVASLEAKVDQLDSHIEKLKGELQDTAAIEAAIYSVIADHGSSSHKVHSPALRLARLYIYACKHWSQERRASYARNSVSGLVVVARACGHDVSRLTYWWSNTVVLRETISLVFDVPFSPPSCATVPSRSHPGGATKSGQDVSSNTKDDTKLIFEQQYGMPNDWRELNTFLAALESLEAWIYATVVESVWWQALTPHMQKSADYKLQHGAVDGFGKEESFHVGSNGNKLNHPECADGNQGNISVDLWKAAFFDTFGKLCPVRAVGVECGCLPMLAKSIMEECVLRLDVAMFNAILRGSEDESPTDPVSDPISDPCVLPIRIGNLTFGAGAQLKNAERALSTWITNLVRNAGVSSFVEHSTEIDEKGLISFPLLKSTGGLLMLPKDMLMDKSIRKEVCPALSLLEIRRLLLAFTPDEFSADPVSPSLLAAINVEISTEKRMHGGMDCNVSSQAMISAPPIIYTPVQSSLIRDWMGEPSSSGKNDLFPSRMNSSLLRRGHMNDEELDELESPINWLLVNSVGMMPRNFGHIISPSSHSDVIYGIEKSKSTAKISTDIAVMNERFQLLRQVWTLE
eukprot:c28590_g1_i1 orf=315-3833(-)